MGMSQLVPITEPIHIPGALRAAAAGGPLGLPRYHLGRPAGRRPSLASPMPTFSGDCC